MNRLRSGALSSTGRDSKGRFFAVAPQAGIDREFLLTMGSGVRHGRAQQAAIVPVTGRMVTPTVSRFGKLPLADRTRTGLRDAVSSQTRPRYCTKTVRDATDGCPFADQTNFSIEKVMARFFG